MENLYQSIFIMICCFGGLWLGAYIHHRGVSIGSGNRESFLGREPKGEVFRLPLEDDLPLEPEIGSEKEDPKLAAILAEKQQRFMNTIFGGEI